MHNSLYVPLLAILLLFTHSACGDDIGASNLKSFEHATFHGAVKTHDFDFSNLSIKAKANPRLAVIRVTFAGALDASEPNIKSEKFQINFHVHPNTNTVYGIKLDARTFSSTIPKKYSYEKKLNRFFIAPKSISSGLFNALYEQLSIEDKSRIRSACYYFSKLENSKYLIDNALSLNNKPATSNDTILQKIKSNESIREQIQTLSYQCFKATERIYVKDIQYLLKNKGFFIGNSDGDWNKFTREAWGLYLQSTGQPSQSRINITTLSFLSKNTGETRKSVRNINYEDNYFDTNQNLLSHSNIEGNLCSFIICSYSLSKKVGDKDSVNVFLAWNADMAPHNSYGLRWSAGAGHDPRTITLDEVYWNYHYVGKSWSNYPGIENYLTNRNWDHAAEYGKTLAVKIIDPKYQDFIAQTINEQISKSQSDGVMLDWWHDYQQSSSGYSEFQVRSARTSIARKLRDLMGPNKIILGNVSWTKDAATVPYINGVYLELTKSSKRLYNQRELRDVENLLEYYDRELQWPRIIALDGWRKTVSNSDKDRNTPENRKMAKLLTAMSVVIPENGFILYADNNADTAAGDHDHLFYDFYSFDIGLPVSGALKVKPGVGYKEHERGFIAYNITRYEQTILRANGQEHLVSGGSGLFCRDLGGQTQCIPYD